MNKAWFFLGFVALAGATGCAPQTPQQVVAQYSKAVESNDPELAYEQLAPNLKTIVSKAQRRREHSN